VEGEIQILLLLYQSLTISRPSKFETGAAGETEEERGGMTQEIRGGREEGEG